MSQNKKYKPEWIRPLDERSPAIWGIRNGIVVSLWPSPIEAVVKEDVGGPRGLLRIGYDFMGKTHLINFIAVEPVVNGRMEFSEISPSKVDGHWGKLMWAGNSDDPGTYFPSALTRGVISNPDSLHPDIEQLNFYVFMEQFENGAHPYLKVTIRSDKAEEIGLEIFSHKGSAAMERCAVTATMGNYSRLRRLYLKSEVVDAKELYKGYTDIHFVEKEGYRAKQMITNKEGDFIVVAEPDETFTELASWPQDSAYLSLWTWRYRPFFKLSQYWRKEKARYDPSLSVRVNGRATYWSGGSNDKNRYINIPGGPAFENFELREKFFQGQKFYFGLSRKTPAEIIGQ
jgi:hypothetical protein